MRKTIVVTTVLVLACATAARAQSPTIAASVTPSTPSAPSALHVAVDGAVPELAGAVPQSLVLSLQRGFRIDLKAVRERCGDRDLATGDCPAASRIGRGTASARASGLLNADIPARIAVFLADRVHASDVAGVVLRIDVAGRSRATRARLLAVDAGPFGYELRVTGIAASIPTLPGVVFSLRSLALDVGAHRTATRTVVRRVRVTRDGRRVTVRRKVRRRVRHDLLRNPRTCAGAWAARVVVRVAGSDRARDVTMPCTPP